MDQGLADSEISDQPGMHERIPHCLSIEHGGMGIGSLTTLTMTARSLID